jgi:hypothetical protein
MQPSARKCKRVETVRKYKKLLEVSGVFTAYKKGKGKTSRSCSILHKAYFTADSGSVLNCVEGISAIKAMEAGIADHVWGIEKLPDL